MLKANTDIREGSEQAAAWGICQSPRDGAGGTQLELYPFGQAGQGPLHACPKLLLLALAAALLCTSTAASTSSLGPVCSHAGTTGIKQQL